MNHQNNSHETELVSNHEPAIKSSPTESPEPPEPTESTEPDEPAIGINRAALTGRHSYIDQFMPVVLFLVLYQFAKNTELAVLAATAWSVKAAISRHRRGLSIGLWIPCVTTYLIVRGTISIAVERDLVDFGVSTEAVYFGFGIGTKVLLGLAAIGTILAGKPFALWVALKIFILPETVRSHQRFIAVLRNITWVIVFYEFGSAVWDMWLFNNSSTGVFVLIRIVANYGVTFMMVMISFLYLDRALSKVPDWPGIVRLLTLPEDETTTGTATSTTTQSESADR